MLGHLDGWMRVRVCVCMRVCAYAWMLVYANALILGCDGWMLGCVYALMR